MPNPAPTPLQALQQLQKQADQLVQSDTALARHLNQQVLPQLEQLARDIAQARAALVQLNRAAHQASQQATKLTNLLQTGQASLAALANFAAAHPAHCAASQSLCPHPF